MRPLLLSLIAFLPAQAPAWEFSPSPVCTLRHAQEGAEIVVTFDPRLPEYAISVTLAEGAWPDAPVFALTFLGRVPLTITTDRHVLSAGGRMLTVRDRGFGNVLRGLESGGEAVAISGATSARVSLAGASEPVRLFRGCPVAATS